MAIMPLIDTYTTGPRLAGRRAASAGGARLVPRRHASSTGSLIEIGRKIRAPESEREGVDTYTRAWGLRTIAPLVLHRGSRPRR